MSKVRALSVAEKLLALGAVQQRLQASRLGAHGGLHVGRLLFGAVVGASSG